jgi:hypothetical protein
MAPNRTPGPAVRAKLSTPCRRARRHGKGHDDGGTPSWGGSRGTSFGGSCGIDAVRIIRDQRCAAATAGTVSLRHVLGRVHGDVRACRRDRLREPAEPGGGTSRPRRCRRSCRSGGTRPRRTGSGGSRPGRTGSPLGVPVSGSARLPATATRRVLWLRMAPEAVTATTRQGRGRAFQGVAGFLGDMFCPHK